MELLKHKIFVFLLFDDSKQGLTGEDQWGRGNKQDHGYRGFV